MRKTPSSHQDHLEEHSPAHSFEDQKEDTQQATPTPDIEIKQNELTLRLDERIKQIAEEYNNLLMQARKEAIEEERPSQEISAHNRKDSHGEESVREENKEVTTKEDQTYIDSERRANCTSESR